TGVSQTRPVIGTNDNGVTFVSDLTNPIPNARPSQAAALGFTLGVVTPAHREAPYYNRWQIGGQHDLGHGWKVESYYVDSRGTHLPVARELNGLPLQYLSTSRTRDATNESFLSQSVANPFLGLLPGSTINGATITRGQLLRPY